MVMKKFYLLMLMAMAGSSQTYAQWNTNATPKCIYSTTYVDKSTGETKTGGDYYACSPKVARTTDGKTWLAWKTWGKKVMDGTRVDAVRTYLQLLDRDGVPQFEEPIMVNDHITPSYWSECALCVAADGSAIVTVADSRTQDDTYVDDGYSPQTFTPAIYKIDQEGNFLWGLDGIDFRDYHDSPFTNAYVVGDDTYFIFNSGSVGDEDTDGIYMVRIADDGTLLWDAPRKMASGMTTKGQILPTTDGDFLYFDDTPDGARVHRFDSDLNEVWGEALVYDDHYFGGYEMNHYRIVPDGMGGACVAFQRFMGTFSHNIRVQHIYEDGSLGFGLEGLDAYNADAYDHNYPSIAACPETEEILVQYASELSGTGNVMHQKFSYDGDYLYDELGMSIASKSTATNTYMFGLPKTGVGSLPDGSWIAVYRDIASYNNESIVIRRYDKDGNRVWTRTIGRNLNVNDLAIIVEPEAAYLFWREASSDKNPGITIFRIAADGTYNVTEPEGIVSTDDNTEPVVESVYSLDGKQLRQPQHGLNVVRYSDGSVEKRVVR